MHICEYTRSIQLDTLGREEILWLVNCINKKMEGSFKNHIILPKKKYNHPFRLMNYMKTKFTGAFP